MRTVDGGRTDERVKIRMDERVKYGTDGWGRG
jgi:hypothetical protein